MTNIESAKTSMNSRSLPKTPPKATPRGTIGHGSFIASTARNMSYTTSRTIQWKRTIARATLNKKVDSIACGKNWMLGCARWSAASTAKTTQTSTQPAKFSPPKQTRVAWRSTRIAETPKEECRLVLSQSGLLLPHRRCSRLRASGSTARVACKKPVGQFSELATRCDFGEIADVLGVRSTTVPEERILVASPAEIEAKTLH